MDSGLLNVFHDDLFDGSIFSKYDGETDLWSNPNEPLELQLTDTLHGILPIPATDVANEVLSSSNLRNDYLFGIKDELTPLEDEQEFISEDPSIETANYRYNSNQRVIEQYAGNVFAQNSTGITSNGIFDPGECEYDSELSDSASTGFEYYHQSEFIEKNVRSCSQSTFRSRTESSSIGDYESHSSDYYDDDHVDPKIYYDQCKIGEVIDADHMYGNGLLIPPEDFHRMCTTPKNAIDVDTLNFGLSADTNSFDLADFITRDYKPVSISPSKNHEVQVVSSKLSDSDLDSDIIVDVETVDNEFTAVNWTNSSPKMYPGEENESAANFRNNTENDPSWNPDNPELFSYHTPCMQKKKINQQKINEEKCSKKSQAKNSKALKKKCVTPQKQAGISSSKKKEVKDDNEKYQKISNCKQIPEPKKVISQLSLHIVQKENVSKANIKDNKPVLENKDVKSTRATSTEVKSCLEETKIKKCEIPPVVVKRKLNLEEYKMRRKNQIVIQKQHEKDSPKAKRYITETQTCTDPSVSMKPSLGQIKSNVQDRINERPLSEVNSIVKYLKNTIIEKEFVDPITDAKNKILRLQERKKAKQVRIIESTVLSKVGKVTKLPTLKDIVDGTCNTSTDSFMNTNLKNSGSDYEEIIIVSTGCNTDISLPPFKRKEHSMPHDRNPCSLLKSSTVFQTKETGHILRNTLFASIQDTVKRISMPSCDDSQIKVSKPPSLIQDTKCDNEHGEDKIIMHLRKDRIRKEVKSITTQTDVVPNFLPLSVFENKGGSQSDKKRRQYRQRKSSSSSDSDNDSKLSQRARKKSSYSSKRRRRISLTSTSSMQYISSSHSETERKSRRNRCSKNSSRRGTSSDRSGSRGKSKSITRKSRSRSHSISPNRARYNWTNMDRNVSVPAVEERRIVYVGRIEQDTNRELLKQKFIKYGSIKQISTHYKDNGMKYGFVTYEEASDAFAVIDGSSNDPDVNLYDISFGGRRAFCRSSYADLDNAGINTYHSYVYPRAPTPHKKEDSFEALLLQVKAKLNATKSSKAQPKI